MLAAVILGDTRVGGPSLRTTVVHLSILADPSLLTGTRETSPKCWLKLRERVCDVSAQCTTGQCSENLGRCYSDFTVPHLHP